MCEGQICLNVAQFQQSEIEKILLLPHKQTPQAVSTLLGNTSVISVSDVKDSIYCAGGIQVVSFSLNLSDIHADSVSSVQSTVSTISIDSFSAQFTSVLTERSDGRSFC